MSWDAQKLDDGPVPLWHQIAERLRAAIVDGEFCPGDALPSEAQLHARFGVSRTTARASLDRLKEDGLISRRSGKGSIVLAPRVEQPANRLSSFGDDMRVRGLTPSYRTVSIKNQAITKDAAKALHVIAGMPTARIQRLLLADGFPIGYSDSWIAPRVLNPDHLPKAESLNKSSLYAWLEKEHGAIINGGRESIGATAAGKRKAVALNIEAGDPLLVARRLCFDADGLAIEFAVIHYRPDRYSFHVELVRG